MNSTSSILGIASNPIDNIQIKIDTGLWQPATGTQSWSYYWNEPTASEGLHTIYLRGYSGSYLIEKSVDVVVDNTNPTLSILTPEQNKYFNSLNVTVSWLGSDSFSGISHYTLKLDDGEWTDLGLDLNHTFENLSQGAHLVKVIAFDNASNQNLSSVLFIVDTEKPIVTITSPAEAMISGEEAMTIKWTWLDNTTGVDHFELRLDGSEWQNIGEGTSHLFKALTQGTHTVDVRAFDLANNEGIATVHFIVDLSPPNLDDNTKMVPTTGDEFTFKVNATDTIDVNSVWIEYWFDSGSSENISMSKSNDYWVHDIIIPESAKALYYIFSANNTIDRWNMTAARQIAVLDNDKPLFGADDTLKTGNTGDPFRFKIAVTDNIAVDGVWVEYWYGTGAHKVEDLRLMRGTDDTWEHTIIVMDTLEHLHYLIYAKDTSENENNLLKRTLPITDNDLPNFGFESSGSPTTGDLFTFELEVTDNIEVNNVHVEYWIGDGIQLKQKMKMQSNGVWNLTMTLPHSIDELFYEFYATDSSGNKNHSDVKGLDILDNDPPLADAGDEVNCDVNSEVILTGSGSWDNIGISNYTWYFFYNSQNIYLYGQEVPFLFAIEGNYVVLLTIKDTAGLMDTDVVHVNVIPLADNDLDGILDNDDADDDNDGLPDAWERKHSFDPLEAMDAYIDFDSDYLTNLDEYLFGTNPENPDTDNDGIPDGAEILKYKTDPNNPDSDNDGYNDGIDKYPLDSSQWVSKKGSTSDNNIHIFVIIFIIVVLVIILMSLIFNRRRHAIKEGTQETTQVISVTPSENATITQPSIATPKVAATPEVQVQVSTIPAPAPAPKPTPTVSPESQVAIPTVVTTEN
jgi:hypothetical protein